MKFAVKEIICKINALDLLSNPNCENDEYYQALLNKLIEEKMHALLANKSFAPASCYDHCLTSVIDREKNN